MKLIFIILFLFLQFSNSLLSESSHGNIDCIGKISIFKVIECVLDHSPEYKFENFEIGALQGKKIVSAYLFPANPIFSFSQSLRNEGQSGVRNVINGEIAVAQEFYISHIRRERLLNTELEKGAQVTKIEILKRNIIADTIKSSIKYEFAKLHYTEAKNLYGIYEELNNVISERVQKGILPPIDADIAESEKIKFFKMLQDSKRILDRSKAELTVMMGIDFGEELEIQNFPDAINVQNLDLDFLMNSAFKNRLEMLLAEKNISINLSKEKILKLEKTPNLTISGFFQRDGFNENVLGGRASLPVRVWRNNQGEIVENQFRSKQLQSLLEVQTHTIKQEVLQSYNDFISFRDEFLSYKIDSIKKADITINGIQKAIKNGQISIKDALLIQQSLLNMKLSYIESRKELLVGGVELLRATGYLLLNIEGNYSE
jgi:outer membrane protein, heavy metal efflux system